MAGVPPPDNEERQLVQAPRVHALQDEAWITQQRVFEEIHEVQPERLQVADFLQESETKSGVIVPNAAQYTRIKWEFPEEEAKERETVPRVRAQDWQPANDTEHVVLKTNYQPSRIQRAWPPPGYGEDEQFELTRAQANKAQDDTGWIQQQRNADADETEEADARGNAPWRRQVGGGALRERVWPPPENERTVSDYTPGPRLNVAWPPPEFEEKSAADVQALQTHYRAQKLGAQWPPMRPDADPNAAVDEPLTAPTLRFAVNA